eukprot:10083-Rhodomonas_salina.1
MSGTVLCVCYAYWPRLSPCDVQYCAIRTARGSRYAMSGTDLGCYRLQTGVSLPTTLQAIPAICLRFRYAVSGTDRTPKSNTRKACPSP